jgi:hypothetical protein
MQTTEAQHDPLSTNYLPSMEESEQVKLVEEKFREAEEARRILEETWLQCVAFRLGKQWHRYNWNTGQLELPRAPSWRVRATHNLIRPKARQASAALTADLPQLDVEPMSSQEQDRLAARVGKDVLQYLHERLRWEKLYVSVADWCVMCGTAFIKDAWDPYSQEMMAAPVAPDPLVAMGLEAPALDAETGEPLPPDVRGLLAPIGQITSQFVSPFEMYPQPGVQSWEDTEWVIHAKVRTLDYIRTRYPEKGRHVKSESENQNGGFLERRVSDIMEAGGERPVQRKQGSAVVLEYWEKPCEKYPDGRLITVANGVVLRASALPHQYLIQRRWLPFTCFVYEPYELRVWGQGLVEDLIPLQREYNRIVSDLLGILKTTGMPKILWPSTAGVGPQAWTTQPGEKIPFQVIPGETHQVLPQVIQPGAIPPVWLEMLDRIKADMDDVAMRHQVSTGNTVPGLTAGVSIQLTQEADNRAFGPIGALFHEAIAMHGMQALALAKENYAEQRLGYITGQEDARALFAFSATDLPDNADVRAVAASKTPMSRAAKQQQLFDLYDRGALGPPGSLPANITLLKRLEFGDVEQLAEEQQMFQQQQMMQQAAIQEQAAMQQMALQAQQGDQQAALEGQKAEQAQAQAQQGQEAQMQMEALKAMMQPAPAAPQGLRGKPQ